MVPACIDAIMPLQWSHDAPQDDFREYSSVGELEALLAEMSQTRDLIRFLEECFVATESRLSGVLTDENRSELPAKGDI